MEENTLELPKEIVLEWVDRLDEEVIQQPGRAVAWEGWNRGESTLSKTKKNNHVQME